MKFYGSNWFVLNFNMATLGNLGKSLMTIKLKKDNF